MKQSNKPSIKPQNPCFSSGPCAKRPGWSLSALDKFSLPGRSHRSSEGKKQLKELIKKHRELLLIPDDYRIGIVPASDTGAFELAMWSMLGTRNVDVFAWESFSDLWLKDITKALALPNVRTFESDYGHIPDMYQADADHDIVFVWNGTTSGARVSDADWISDDRAGLTFCDATSAVFAYDMPWEKLDVTTWSWQKVLGGEAAHGMIVLSPRAVERLESFVPQNRPLPKIFRLTQNGKINEGIFEGITLNTPSMLAVADCMDALSWVEDIGGLNATKERCQRNFDAVEQWVRDTSWIEFLAPNASTRSLTAVCLVITDSWFTHFDHDGQMRIIKDICALLEQENAAYDIKSYRDAPPGLRIWCGATVETNDIKAALPWIEWGYEQVKTKIQKAAA